MPPPTITYKKERILGMNSVISREELARAVTSGEPVKMYIKTILGKVNVTIWDIFENTPVSILLEGDPRKNEDGSFVELFSDYEVSFFKKANKRHFELGNLREYEKPTGKAKERRYEEYTDEELKAIINSPFLKLQNVLNKITTVALLFRIEQLALELDKSEAIMSAIRSRLQEVQQEELPVSTGVIEDEVR